MRSCVVLLESVRGRSSHSLPSPSWLPLMPQSHKQSLHLAQGRVQRPGELRPGCEETAELDFAQQTVTSSSSPSHLVPAPRVSVKKHSPNIFTTCVIFLFYIRKENSFDTPKTIQGNFIKKHIVLSRLKCR